MTQIDNTDYMHVLRTQLKKKEQFIWVRTFSR